jgi:predicted AlkP superfamily phosphohydrolase/phosphomutase
MRFRDRLLPHVTAGLWAGMMVGVLLGALASFWGTAVSFLFSITNEIAFTWAYRHLSAQAAASLGTPFALFCLHYFGTVLCGGLLGLGLGSIFSLLRVHLRRRVAWYVLFLLLPVTFAYGYLWLLHLRLQGGGQRTGILVMVLLSLGLSGVAGFLAALVRHFLRAFRAAEIRIDTWTKLLGIIASGILLLLFGVGLVRGFGRNAGSTPEEQEHARWPVIVIGVDGASWAYLRPLIEEGSLPNLARLVEEGVSGRLRSMTPPIKSPVVWTSIATGKRPEKHGIRDFVIRLPGRKGREPVTNDMRRAEAFWEIASEAGRTVDVVSWCTTWPAEEVNGVFVSDRVLFPGLDRVAVPASWSDTLRMYSDRYLEKREELLARFTARPFNPRFRELDRTTEDYLMDLNLFVLDFSNHKDMTVFNVARDLLRRGQPDLFAVYFEGVDRTSHKFLEYEFARRHRRIARVLYPDLDHDELLMFGNVLRQYYVEVDHWIGELLSLANEETAVLVVSDHGFGLRKPREVSVEPNPLLEFLGYLEFDPERGKRPAWGSTVLHGQSDYSVGGLGRIYVNWGGGDRGEEIGERRARELMGEAEAALRGLRTVHGRPVFRKVERGRGSGTRGSQGDILIRLDEDCLGDTVVYEGQRLPVSAFTRVEMKPGNHRIDGVFIGRGGPFRRGGSIRNVGILDIAPTLLRIAGLPPARDMDGRSLDRAFEPTSRGEMVRGMVETYALERSGEAEEPGAPPRDEEILEQLKALGYID